MHRHQRLLRTGAFIFYGLFLAAASFPAAAEDEMRMNDPLAVGTTAWRIVGYTRWPVEPDPLHVCVMGPTENSEAMHYLTSFGMHRREALVREWRQDRDAIEDCDVLYVGKSAIAEFPRLLQQLSGHPILTIGEAPVFCSHGGMFCFDLKHEGVRFEANLDAIGRSNLRVNPQVLRLALPLDRDEE